MERAAGLAHDAAPQTKLDKLDAVLAQRSTTTQDAALFAEMLSLLNDGRYPRSTKPRNNAGKKHWRRSLRKSRR